MTPSYIRRILVCIWLISVFAEVSEQWQEDVFITESDPCAVAGLTESGGYDGSRRLIPHPERCDLFIECGPGIRLTRQCAPTLLFNEEKGVCDYPHLARCIVHPSDIKTPESKLYAQDIPRPHSVPNKQEPSYHLHPQQQHKEIVLIKRIEDKHRDEEIKEKPSTYKLSQAYNHSRYGKEKLLKIKSIQPDDPTFSAMKDYCSRVMDYARDATRERLRDERQQNDLASDGIGVSPFQFVSNFFSSSSYAVSLCRPGITLMQAVKLIGHKFKMRGQQVLEALIKYELTNMLKPLHSDGTAARPDAAMPEVPQSGDFCPYPADMKCDEKLRFRTFDGSCNNLDHPIIGRAMTPYSRLLSAKYADGTETMRVSVTGTELPGARTVSRMLFTDIDRSHPIISMAFVFFGQFVDHDLTRTAIYKLPAKNGSSETMDVKCGSDGCQSGEGGFQACWPIAIAEDDSEFAYNRCLKFVRSMEVPHLNCHVGAREQLNQNTHWLDASQIYGSSVEEALKLRDSKNPARGRMLMTSHPIRNLKPLLPSETKANVCKNDSETFSCFKAGDTRVNENIGLGMYHTLFIRYHNLIEESLYNLNGEKWSGDRLYEETRKIVGATLQHIVFNEYLPLVVGPDLIKRFELDILESGHYHGYDSSIDARISNSFAAAAYRFGHTLLTERIHRTDEHQRINSKLWLSQTFNRPAHLHASPGGIDSFIRGLSGEPSQSFDWFFTKQVTRSLFADRPPMGLGHDLGALNIQRGRDHGLATYNDYREYCGLTRASTFDDLAGEVTDSNFRGALKRVYVDVDDIDLYAGGVSETPMGGAVVGPTFGCIIASMFRKLRKGDRYWYENAEAGFTEDQLAEIRKITMASILCLNGDHIQRIQPFVFLQPSTFPEYAKPASVNTKEKDFASYNLLVPCKSIPDIEWATWRI